MLASARAAPFRVIHDSPGGVKLIQFATAVNQELIASREAHSSMIECRELFSKGSSHTFLETGQDDQDGSFALWMTNIASKCSLLPKLAGDEGFTAGLGKETCDAFWTMATSTLSHFEKLVLERVSPVYEVLSTNVVIQTGSGCYHTFAQDIGFILEKGFEFCGPTGFVQTMLKLVKPEDGNTLADLKGALDKCFALLSSVTRMRVGSPQDLWVSFFPRDLTSHNFT